MSGQIRKQRSGSSGVSRAMRSASLMVAAVSIQELGDVLVVSTDNDDVHDVGDHSLLAPHIKWVNGVICFSGSIHLHVCGILCKLLLVFFVQLHGISGLWQQQLVKNSHMQDVALIELVCAWMHDDHGSAFFKSGAPRCRLCR